MGRLKKRTTKTKALEAMLEQRGKFRVMGLRLTNRDPMLDRKTGEVIDDGHNENLTLNRNLSEAHADQQIASFKEANPDPKVWKFWKEKQ